MNAIIEQRASHLIGPASKYKGHRANCRAILYSFFAQALSPPGEALVRDLCDGSLRSTVEAAVRGAPVMHRAMLDQAVLADLTAPCGERVMFDALLVEYTRLWGIDIICPHYETDYLDGASFRAVHTIADVAAFYSAFGVRVAAGARERPDYMGIELAFMNFLATKQAHAISQGSARHARLCRRAQTKFFAEHLGRWAVQFADTLVDAAHGRFHRAVGGLLRGFVTAEAHYLVTQRDVVEPPVVESPGVRRLKVIG